MSYDRSPNSLNGKIRALTLAAGLAAHTAAAQRMSVAAIDRMVRAEVDSGFSGVVLVARGDSTLLLRSYGRVTAPGEHFWIASITKSFTAAAILALQHDRRLSVHDTLGAFLGRVPADKRAITIHQLLTHTAGFRGATTGAGITDRDDAVRAILAQPLAYAPGNGYEYGNDDYALLAAIIEVVTHEPWAAFVARRIATPAGLSQTGFPNGVSDWGHHGSNGMRSTASDMLRWSRLVSGGKIGSLSVADIITPQVLVRRNGPIEVWCGY